MVQFLKLLSQWLKLEFGKVLMQVMRNVLTRLAYYGIPVMAVKILGVGQLRQDELFL